VVLIAQKTVTGTVLDSEGEPMIAVNVIEKGTTNGTATDSEGKYSLSVAGESSVLVFSFTGYKTQEITVGSQSTVDITIQEDAEVLDEVVVSALGFTQNKDQLGSTYSKVDPGDMNRSGETTLINSLAAKASNVQISSPNGDPGAGSTIRIRGANTISGSSNPLIILDGVPISNSTIYGGGNNVTGGRTGGVSQQSRLNDINPNDIESMQILKGASAAALWGSRAANGVIVITTKNGKRGQPKISYKFSRSFDQVHERVPMQTIWGQGRSGVYGATRAESWGDYIPDRSGGADDVDQSGQYFEAEDGTLYYPIDNKNSTETFVDQNWDQVFQTGGFAQHDFSISGGNERATYFFSFGRLDQEGIIRNSDYNRTNLRLNNKFILSDWLTVTSKAGYTNSFSNRIQQNSNTAGLMLGMLRTPPDFDISDYKGTYYDSGGGAFTGRHRSYRRYLGGSSSNPIYNNPLWTINEQTSETQVNRFIMSNALNINPTSWLSFIVRGGVDYTQDTRVYFFPIGSAGDRNPGVLAEDLINNRELNFDAIGKANFNLTDEIALNATVGWNINDQSRRINSANITGFLVNADKTTSDLNTAAENSTFSNTKRFLRTNRGYAIFAFDMFRQLYISLSGALEASSAVEGTFFYPAVDVAWQFTEATEIPGLSFGKLRASYGVVGVSPPPHVNQTLAESGFSYSTYSDPLNISLFGGGFRIDDDRGNPNLQPEFKTEWEIGTDLRFLDDKLALTATYYQNRIEGMIIAVDLAPSFGYDTQFDNAASMENRGFEADLDYTIVDNNDLNIGILANFGRNRNEVTDLAGTETIDLSGASVSSRAIVGQQLGVLYGTGSQTNDDGSFILNDDGFPQITTSPIILGDPNPDWRGGLGLRAGWKGFNLNVLFEHSQGGSFSPRSLWVLRRFGTTAETANRVTLTEDLTNYAGDVIPAGTTVRGNIEDFGGGNVLLDESWYRTGIGGGFGDNQAYNFSIKDATFTRLRELTLSYTLNNDAFKNATKLGSINLAFTGRNLFTWDGIEGIDPQVNQIGVSNGFGLEYFTNPSTRSFLFTLTVNY
jgi:TonB-linked SusC/RagA family outer membrane protein